MQILEVYFNLLKYFYLIGRGIIGHRKAYLIQRAYFIELVESNKAYQRFTIKCDKVKGELIGDILLDVRRKS